MKKLHREVPVAIVITMVIPAGDAACTKMNMMGLTDGVVNLPTK